MILDKTNLIVVTLINALTTLSVTALVLNFGGYFSLTGGKHGVSIEIQDGQLHQTTKKIIDGCLSEPDRNSRRLDSINQ